MAEKSCRYVLLLFLLLLFPLSICCSGTIMGFSNNARSKTATSLLKALTTMRQDEVLTSQLHVLVSDFSVLHRLSNDGVSDVIYLKRTQFGSLRSSKPLLVSGMKTHLRSHKTKPVFRKVVVSSTSDSSKRNKLQMLLPILRSANSLFNVFKEPVKTSVALQLSQLNSLNMNQRRHLNHILHLIRETESFLILEDSVNGEWNMADGLVQEIINKAKLINSLLPRYNLPIVLSIRSSTLPSATQVSTFSSKILRSLHNHPQISSTLTALLVEVAPVGSHRVLLASYNDKSIIHDMLSPPTTSFDPTTPVTNPVTTPSGFPPYTPTPTVVTIPGTNPVSSTPMNPVSSAIPISVTPTGPTSIPAPALTDPSAEPVTNPVTTYPSPSTTSPVTTPMTSPGAANAPILPGQTWCVAKSGVSEATLQAALDYACGIGGAECSMIQEGSSCYDPNSLENHASYAFNSYFQKNPAATSCDFGGAAVLVNTNPSSGACTYPSSATAAVPSTIPPATTAVPSMIPPATTEAPSTIPPATTASSSGSTGIGSSYGSPPSVLNTSGDPTSGSSTGFGFGYGSESPPIITAPPSGSSGLQPLFCFTTSIAILAMIRLGV